MQPPRSFRSLRPCRPGTWVLTYACLTFSIWAGSAQPDLRPNILLAIADDWSYGHAGAYGCNWVRTPGFDRVASEGVLFTRAYTPNAKCAPSRSCILTGRNSWQLKAAANHICFFPPEFKTYAEALAENGYFVGHTAKGWAPGIARDQTGKPRLMAGRAFNRRKAPPPASGIGGNDYAGNFEDFLNAVPGGTPWCFWYGALEPHRGYEFGSGVAKGHHRPSDIDRVPDCWPDDETIRNDMLDYAFEVEHFDRHLDRMLNLLDQRGLAGNTLVVATSDHGMPFPRVKGQAYDDSNHVPLAIRWPDGVRAPGRTVTDYVSFIDLAPTFIEIAGLDWQRTGMAPVQGSSLTDLLSTEQAGWINPQRDHVLIGKERHDIGRPNDWGYPIRGIAKNNFLYLRNYETDRWPAGNPETGYLNCDGSPTKTELINRRRANGTDPLWQLAFGKRPAEELYDVVADPDCINNLAGQPAYDRLRQGLGRQLTEALKAQQDPRAFGRGEVFELYPYANAGGRGFYERFEAGETMRAGWVNRTDFEPQPLD